MNLRNRSTTPGTYREASKFQFHINSGQYLKSILPKIKKKCQDYINVFFEHSVLLMHMCTIYILCLCLNCFSIGPVVTCWGLHQPEYMIKARNKRPSFGICVSNYVKDWETTLRRRRYDKYYQYLLIVILCVSARYGYDALQFHLLLPMSSVFCFE